MTLEGNPTASPHAAPEPKAPAFHGLPSAWTQQLFGREALLTELKQHLLAGSDLALCAGLPGAGKTALAQHLARDPEIKARFHDYILWVTLGQSPVVEPELYEWAGVLGLTPVDLGQLNRDQLSTLITNTIGEQHVLVVIDDVWDIEDARNFRVGGSNTRRILTTRLGEVATNFVGAVRVAVDELDEQGRIEFFKFLAPTVMDDRPEAVRATLQEIGGLPLEIIVIAKYLANNSSTFPELDQAFSDVREKMLELPTTDTAFDYRIKSLRAAISLSDEKLDPAVREAFRALSVFPPKVNTFSGKAAAEISQTARVASQLERAGLVDVVDRHLERYTMHMAIRRYAETSRTDEDAFPRMATYFAGYVDEQGQSIDDKSVWLETLELEKENIDAALAWAVRAPDAECGMRLASALFDFWYERCHFDQGRQWIDLLLGLEESEGGEADIKRLRAKLLNDYGNFAYSQTDLAEADHRYRGSHEFREELHDERAVAGSLNNLGLILRERGDYDGAEARFRAALKINEKYISTPELSGEDAAKVVKHHTNWKGRNLNNLGVCAFRRAEWESARDLQSASCDLFEAVGHAWGQAMARSDRGDALYRLDDPSQAEADWQWSLHTRAQIRDGRGLASTLRSLAEFSAGCGDSEGAEHRCKAAVIVSKAHGDLGGVAASVEGLGMLASRSNDCRTAVRYFAAAEAFRQGHAIALPMWRRDELDHEFDSLKSSLEEPEFRSEYEAGQSSRLAEVANEALAGDERGAEDVFNLCLRESTA